MILHSLLCPPLRQESIIASVQRFSRDVDFQFCCGRDPTGEPGFDLSLPFQELGNKVSSASDGSELFLEAAHLTALVLHLQRQPA